MRSVIGLCATFGTLAGGYVPALWGDSGLSLTSFVCAALGGLAGVWLGARLSTI
ncbi:MAG: hypothetical protein ACJ76I_03835 [Gaiellaceae bacterium]